MSPAHDRPFRVLSDYAADRLEKLRDRLAAALDGAEVEAVHAVRVTTRRLSEAIELMRPWLPESAWRKARRPLREVRRAFRKVRDLDVLLASLAEPRSDDVLDAVDRAQLEGELTRRRAAALRRAAERARRVLSGSALEKTAAALSRFNRRADRSARGLSDVMGDLLTTRATELAALDPTRSSSGDLHPLRIGVKRLRYVVELSARLGRGELDGPIEELTAMQDLLGAWNDHIFAARTLAKLACRPRVLAAQSTWCARLLGASAARMRLAEVERQAVLERWPRLRPAIDAILDPHAALRGAAIDIGGPPTVLSD
ncbi:MAG: CHAD domain-containing protein [Phycisphaerae bacterium]